MAVAAIEGCLEAQEVDGGGDPRAMRGHGFEIKVAIRIGLGVEAGCEHVLSRTGAGVIVIHDLAVGGPEGLALHDAGGSGGR
jgi:hypothetical protein